MKSTEMTMNVQPSITAPGTKSFMNKGIKYADEAQPGRGVAYA